MADEQQENQDRFLGLNPDEEKFAKSLIAKGIFTSITQPLTVSRTLIQLGYEPFPLSTGKTLIFAGRDAYFLPNVFSYAHQLANSRGLAVLWTGWDSNIVTLVVKSIAAHHTEKYINEYYPNIGGEPENLDKEEENLTDDQSFRRVLRQAMRDSVVQVASTIAARPFTVVLVRQIAQIIGNETKYSTTFKSLTLVGNQEGPAGLFSGLVPQIVGELTVLWGVSLLTYGVQRLLLKTEIGDVKQKDETAANAAKEVHTFVRNAIPFVVNSFGYPYGVVSAVMAVAGSGLAVSFLPYSPAFSTWHNSWDYLYPTGLKRGARLFLREQTGPVSVGSDQQLYAQNKHFA